MCIYLILPSHKGFRNELVIVVTLYADLVASRFIYLFKLIFFWGKYACDRCDNLSVYANLIAFALVLHKEIFLSQLKVYTSLDNMRWHPLYSSSDPIIQNAFQNLNHEGNQTLQQVRSES